jgi:glycosyltransferase involved in cell wall biosynthesis
MDNYLVSVVIPAFNASDTILEALESVSQQTYRNLEIVVVDDGSTDGTSALVQHHQQRDARVRLIQKPNGGVASARNAGIRSSLGAFVAFIDADDLWHPTKIAKQMTALLAGGPETALVYSPFRVIDIDGKVLSSSRRFGASGWVLYRHFHANLVGNGSSILVRKEVLEELGGFDPRLREAGAEGCEDLLLQLRIAARYRFAEVSEYLVGYRRRPGSMSSNAEQMIRSGVLAVRIALSECGDVPHLSIDAVLNRYEWQRLRCAARQGQIGDALWHSWRQFSANPGLTAAAFWNDLLLVAPRLSELLRSRPLGRVWRSPEAPPAARHFYDFDPSSDIDRLRPVSRAVRRLALLDQSYRPKTKPAGPQHSFRGADI